MLIRWAYIGKKWHPAFISEFKLADIAKDV
jgi:hypothetical protein